LYKRGFNCRLTTHNTRACRSLAISCSEGVTLQLYISARQIFNIKPRSEMNISGMPQEEKQLFLLFVTQEWIFKVL